MPSRSRWRNCQLSQLSRCEKEVTTHRRLQKVPLELLAPVGIERLVRVSVLRCSIEAVVEDEEVRPCAGATPTEADRELFV